MTLEQIAEGLDAIVFKVLARDDMTGAPEGWAPHEWAYVKGIATAEILQLRDRLRTVIAQQPGVTR